MARSARPVRSQVRLDDPDGAGVALDEGGVGGAPRERLDAGRAAPREQVQEPWPRQVRLEDREQGLLDPVAERPGPLPGRLEADASGPCRR